MEGQTENSYLVERMPSLVIEKILSNILNLTNVSRTCKDLYKYVCQMDKRRSVACIGRLATTGNPTRLTIDDDGVYDSIINSLRKITNIRVDVDSYPFTVVDVNERQLERLTAIMQHFEANINSLVLRGIAFSTDTIIELLNQTPKLESLEFVDGKVFGTATTPLNLSSLKKLSIRNYRGLLEIVNVLPAGSLIHFSTLFQGEEDRQSGIIQNILSKQHQVTSLQIGGKTDPAVLCVNHLKLEKLELGYNDTPHFDQFQLVDILKCHTNLKELRLSNVYPIRMWAFEWICENLKELEVLRVAVDSPETNVYSMLAKLKKLRYFSTNVKPALPDAKFQLRIDSLAKLEIGDNSWTRSNEHFNQMVQSMVRSFTNLTALEIKLKDFSELSFVLSQCATLIHFTTSIMMPNKHKLAQKCFPNIRYLTIDTFPEKCGRTMSVIINIVRAMPNLKSLWVPRTEIEFNLNAVRNFIQKSKNLDELQVRWFKFDQVLSATDDFVDTIRRLSDQLKAYRFRFRSDGQLDLNPIVDILSNEFNVPGYKDGSCYFDLCKGILSKFRA